MLSNNIVKTVQYGCPLLRVENILVGFLSQIGTTVYIVLEFEWYWNAHDNNQVKHNYTRKSLKHWTCFARSRSRITIFVKQIVKMGITVQDRLCD